MERDQFERAVLSTRTLLEGRMGNQAIAAERCPGNEASPPHLSWMLAQALGFYDAGKPDKANRWLGFVQGVLASVGVDVEALKRANMPEGEQFDAKRV